MNALKHVLFVYAQIAQSYRQLYKASSQNLRLAAGQRQLLEGLAEGRQFGQQVT